ncbi:mitochondrial inner membrane peptidase complex catalytic subunit 2 [Peziza echinospora]|nr:mitochondrial inner membrane peptidase complex catalytic subunit 2 [Peziza echinospora]
MPPLPHPHPLPSLLPPLARLLLWTPALIFLNDHLFALNWVRGRSMQPTLSPLSPISRDCVFVRKLSGAGKKEVGRGEVVLLRSPVDAEQVVVKRVVGVEGDVVRGRRELVVVPRGHVWVEGDEGFHSRDSNEYGPVPRGLLTARVTHIVWPLERFGRVKGGEEGVRRGAVVMRAEERVG